MSYGETITTKVGTTWVECDRCGKREERHIAGNYHECNVQAFELHVEVISEGWTFWAGRSLRTYCNNCSPSPGHRMTDVTASYREKR